MEYENLNYNQINENMTDEMNNFDTEEDNQYNQYDRENEFEEEYLNNNNYMSNKENIFLKKKNEELIKLINQKDQQLIKYQKMVQNFNALQNELKKVKKKYNDSSNEIRIKNKIIKNLENNTNNFNIDNNNIEQNENNFLFIIQQIKNIEKDILEEDLEDEMEDTNEFDNLNKESLMNKLMDILNSFYQKLNAFKNKYMGEIFKLRNMINQLNVNNNNNNSNLLNNIIIKDQYYLKIIDLIKNLCSNFSKNEEIGQFPAFSLNDDNNNRNKNIINTIKILSDYIISNYKNNSSENIINNNIDNIITNESFNSNKINEELNKRLKEMSEILVKSNENLIKARKDNIELKQKLSQLELKYNSIKDNNNNNIANKDKECEKLKEELNKKNKQIKSLEEKITKLINIPNKNDNKILNYTNNNIIKESLYFKNNNFVRDEKSEKILKNFLDKFTDGEYGNDNLILNKKSNEDSKINDLCKHFLFLLGQFPTIFGDKQVILTFEAIGVFILEIQVIHSIKALFFDFVA